MYSLAFPGSPASEARASSIANVLELAADLRILGGVFDDLSIEFCSGLGGVSGLVSSMELRVLVR